jgi:hypothetical protein
MICKQEDIENEKYDSFDKTALQINVRIMRLINPHLLCKELQIVQDLRHVPMRVSERFEFSDWKSSPVETRES